MLEFKGFIALGAFEFAQDCTLVMTDHVTLEAVDIGEGFVANFARLQTQIEKLGFRENNQTL